MEKIKVLAIVERGKGKDNFSAFSVEEVNGCGFTGWGRSARSAMENIKLSVEEFKQMAAEKCETFPDVEFDFRLDIGAFFDYYPLDVTQVAKYIGVNASVLRQYVSCLRIPREHQIQTIKQGIHKLTEDLALGLMIDRPPVSYVN